MLLACGDGKTDGGRTRERELQFDLPPRAGYGFRWWWVCRLDRRIGIEDAPDGRRFIGLHQFKPDSISLIKHQVIKQVPDFEFT